MTKNTLTQNTENLPENLRDRAKAAGQFLGQTLQGRDIPPAASAAHALQDLRETLLRSTKRPRCNTGR